MSDYTAISPAHYRDHPSGVEPIEFTRAMTFCAGNAAKYICRAGRKGDALTDWRKAAQYLEWADDARGSAFFRIGSNTKNAASALEAMRLYIAGEGDSAKASALDRVRRNDYPDALSIAREEIARLEAEEAMKPVKPFFIRLNMAIRNALPELEAIFSDPPTTPEGEARTLARLRELQAAVANVRIEQ